jgi:hypothetical protein
VANNPRHSLFINKSLLGLPPSLRSFVHLFVHKFILGVSVRKYEAYAADCLCDSLARMADMELTTF